MLYQQRATRPDAARRHGPLDRGRREQRREQRAADQPAGDGETPERGRPDGPPINVTSAGSASA
jgi:hypothetical protein